MNFPRALGSFRAVTLLGLLFTTVVLSQEPTRNFDYGDRSSATLTGKAWAAYTAKDIAAVQAYTQMCIDMYASTALQQQNALSAPVPTTDKEAVFQQWALNDVGTCYFILGQTLEAANQPAEALAAYQVLVDKLPFAQCWDEKGWFWSPAAAAKGRLKALEFEAAQA